MRVNYNATFYTAKDAHLYIEQEYQRYHPCGYGTSLTAHALPSGHWRVLGWRMASCD